MEWGAEARAGHGGVHQFHGTRVGVHASESYATTTILQSFSALSTFSTFLPFPFTVDVVSLFAIPSIGLLFSLQSMALAESFA